MLFSAGARLGPYEIVSTLGRGGMGEVYKARDSRLNRFVALKVLPDTAALDPERRDRFEREARAVAALNHPHIVTIHSVETVEGVPLLTMELVEGRALSDVIPKGGLALAEVLRIAIAVADAIAAAHQKGITHRDLKPGNVMVGERSTTAESRCSISASRSSRMHSRESSGATTIPGAPATEEGRILGTAAYMSPEQAEGKPVDARSDLFSLRRHALRDGDGPAAVHGRHEHLDHLVHRQRHAEGRLPTSIPRCHAISDASFAARLRKIRNGDTRVRRICEMIWRSSRRRSILGNSRLRPGTRATGPLGRGRVCTSSGLVVGRRCRRGGPRRLPRRCCCGTPSAPAPIARLAIALPEDVSPDPGRVLGAPAISPDGTTVALTFGSEAKTYPRAPPPGFRYVSTSAGHRRRQAGVLVAGQPSHRILCGHHAEASSARRR